jgi:ParB/RepB/Spo0J family partition protein
MKGRHAMTTLPSGTSAEPGQELAEQWLDLEEIDRSRNHRLNQPGDDDRIQALAESMASTSGGGGQLQAVRVYETSSHYQPDCERPYILGFGARRCLAAERLGWQQIRAVVHPPAPDDQIESARAIENLHRQDIGPMEEVRAVAQLLKQAQNLGDPRSADPYEHVAAQLARSVSWVRDRDYLHRLSEPVQQLALKAQIPAGHLRELAKVGDPEDQWELAKDAAGVSPLDFGERVDSIATRLGPGETESPETLNAEALQRIAEGSINRMRLSDLKAKVEAIRCKLKGVPWDLSLPVMHLPACEGCQHNTATDNTLFGSDDGGDLKKAHCTHPSCWKQKRDAAEKEKQKLQGAIQKKRQTKKHAARKLGDVVDELRPDWLKRDTAVRVAKKVDPASLHNGDSDGPDASSQSSGGKGHAPSQAPAETPEQAFYVVKRDWAQRVVDRIIEAVQMDPKLLPAVTLLQAHDGWREFNADPDAVSVQQMCDLARKLAAEAFNGKTPPAQVELARHWLNCDRTRRFGLPMWADLLDEGDPAMIEALANGLSIDTPARPQLEDFQPEKASAEVEQNSEPEAGGKKKAARKKTAKKAAKKKAAKKNTAKRSTKKKATKKKAAKKKASA